MNRWVILFLFVFSFFLKGNLRLTAALRETPSDIAALASPPAFVPKAQNDTQLSVPPIWQRIFETADVASYYGYVAHLSETIGTRPYGSAANAEAVSWIVSTMESIAPGAIAVEIWGGHQSVVGIIEGYDESLTDIILIGGHMDTVKGSPGADDDASGTAMALEALRILSQFQLPRDVYFMAFNAEEIGLIGSGEIAAILETAQTEIIMAFTADQILYDYTVFDNTWQGKHITVSTTNPAELHAAILMQNASRRYGTDSVSLMTGGPTNSDHTSFRNRGFNALVAFESVITPFGHMARDNIHQEEYNFTKATEATASVAVAMAQLAFQEINETADFDHDGLLDVIEVELGTEVGKNDTDGDGLLDGVEVNEYQTNPLAGDSDNDSLSDGEEALIWNTNPLSIDTDNDSLTDYEEIIVYRTNPVQEDTDSDGLADGIEVNIGTDPKSEDSDGDFIPDGEEIEQNWDPLDPAIPETGTSETSADTSGFLWGTIAISLGLGIQGRRKKE
ncbi:MAG: M20/M25/M40 family metallo-hydrolase [Candidatus Thorarchaeota archaeon]